MDYDVSIDAVMGLAKTNYSIAERYAEVAKKMTRTDAAVSHLTDKNGEATAADRDIIAMLDEFFAYLKTTASRYLITAEQLEASAKTYVDWEDDQKSTFDDHAAEFEQGKIRDYNPPWNPDEVVQDTKRPDEATTDQPDGFGTEENPVEGDESVKE